MKHLRKSLFTLVALFAISTGAWAQTGENIFQYCYDCQRNPAFPTTTGSTSLSGFQNPYVGYNGSGIGSSNTSNGPWKLEYMGIWSMTDNYGIYDVSYYQNTYNCTDVPVFRLYQWNATANEYQHAAYGVVCCYAKVSNAVDHTALFVSEGGLGCFLTNNSHSSAMNITFDEDLTTGLTTIIAGATPGGAGTPEPAAIELTKSGDNQWTLGQTPDYDLELQVEYYGEYALKEIPANWQVEVDGVDKTAAIEGDSLKITETAQVLLTPDHPEYVKSVRLVEVAAPQPQTLIVYKGSTGLSGHKELYYMPGDTYRQALARPENQSGNGLGWGFWESATLTTIFFKEVSSTAWDVTIDSDYNFAPGIGTCAITLDSVIDPNHAYQFIATD